jgi:hypothetical protein
VRANLSDLKRGLQHRDSSHCLEAARLWDEPSLPKTTSREGRE